MTKIEQLAEIIRNSDNIVFFGGAGVSTESHYNSLYLFCKKWSII